MRIIFYVLKKICSLINFLIPKAADQIVFVDGTKYPDSIYAILKEYNISRNKKKFSKITVVHFNNFRPYFNNDSITFVQYKTIKSLFRLFRAKYIVTDILFGVDYLSKRQVIINVWHGLGLKKILALSDEFKDRKKPLSDYAMAYSDFFRDVIKRCFLIDNSQVLVSGSPRNDLFFVGRKSDLDILYKGLSKFNKVLIWMPTYRQSTFASSNNDGKNYEFGIPLIDRNNIKILDSKLRKFNFFLLIKHHALQDRQKELDVDLTNIKIITTRDITLTGLPLYQIIGQCDALITDYSSIFFEYMILNRPICYAYDDFEEYDSKRGFMFKNAKSLMVGYHATVFHDLLRFIDDFSNSKDIYSIDRNNIVHEMRLYTDAQNSKRLLKLIKFID